MLLPLAPSTPFRTISRSHKHSFSFIIKFCPPGTLAKHLEVTVMPLATELAFTAIQGLTPSEELWKADAACSRVPEATDLFFSEELHDIAAAKRICVACPVIAPCLEAAVARVEPCGVWGGQLFAKGKILTIKRRRGRPPKQPRLEDQLPVVPVPERFQRLIA